MSSITEIEKAIEKLPAEEVEELVNWLQNHLLRRSTTTEVETWLKHARGAAVSGKTTSSILALTRAE